MAFSRKSTLAAVAGSLSLAMLTGCPAAPTTPSPSPTATAAPSSPSPTATPGTGESPAPGVTPSVTPSESPLENTTIRGTVFDLDGARVDAAKVTVKSLNPSNPFDSTVDVINGTYVVNSVPAGVQLEVTATKDGWTTRSRVETLLPLTASDETNIVNFGGSSNDDSEGRSYFISKYPEIMAVEPAEDATGVDPSSLTVKLTLSEALDTTNQRRFEDAIRVVPGNSFASLSTFATSTVPNLEDTATTASGLDDFAYAIAENSTFLGDDDTRATVEWTEEGKVATLTFNAPLLSAEDDAAKYQIVMVAPGAVIEDADGNDFGVYNGSFGGYASAPSGTILGGTFKEADLAVPSGSTGVAAWLASHSVASTFEVAEDETTPTLTGVSVTELTGSTRITFTFSEPIAAYAGGGDAAFGVDWMGLGTVAAGSTDVLDNFTFAVAENAADLDDVELDGDSPTAETLGGDLIGNSSAEREREFYFVPGGTATLGFEVNPDDAKQLRLVISDATVFGNEVNAIKARVEGVEDPAGNAITDTQADANVVSGSI